MSNTEIFEKAASFFETFERKGGEPLTTHYCPGCGHGIVHKLIAEAIDDFGLQDRTIMIASVGCSVFVYYYFQTAAISCPHGRAPAVATGISRSHGDAVTISYQGDGDLAAIGTSHTIHAANRGENMVVFFVNNNNYGMTGGQMAPTSLLGQKTTTSPYGRSLENEGAPIKIAEIIAKLDAPILVARTSIHSPRHIRECRKLIRRGLEAQRDRKGYVFIEILAQCPTNLHLTPEKACEWIEDVVVKEFPLGIFKDTLATALPKERKLEKLPFAEIARRLDLHTSSGDRPEAGPGGFKTAAGTASVKLPLKVKIGGFGGQGILSLGHALATLAMKKGYEVSWLPSYGPEMRGGAANCSVVISNTEIGSPMVESPDLLVVMNKPSMLAFGPKVVPGGHIFYNESMIDAVPENLKGTLHPFDATNIALKIGNSKVANTILLAVIAKKLGLFSREELAAFVETAFEGEGKEKIREQNHKAVEIGWNMDDE